MNKVSMYLITIILIFVFANAHAVGTAKDLEGLSIIYVTEPNTSGDIEKFGISAKKMKEYVEMRLRLCGIRVAPNHITYDAACSTWIINPYIVINLLYVCGSMTSAHLNIELLECANLKRNESCIYGKQLTNSMIFQYGDNYQLGKAIMGSLEDFMNTFTNLYLEANPREFITKDKP